MVRQYIATASHRSESHILELPSDTTKICILEQYLYELKERHGICDDMFGKMLVTLTEAVTNAIIHGNGEERTKTVKISTKCDGRFIQFEVQDEGKGFNPNLIPDPTKPENLEKIGGRGVFLMRELSDELYFVLNGQGVCLKFNISSY